MNDDISWDLLAKYFFDECSEEEAAKVQAWIEEDPRREILLEELDLVWRMTRDAPSPESWDVEALWNRVEKQTREQEAAADRSAKPSGDPSRKAPDRSSQRKRTRRRSSHIQEGRFSRWKAALGVTTALVVVAAAMLWLGWPLESNPWTDASLEARTFSTQEGQRAVIRLIDGTRVHLNVDSRLTLSATFGETRRGVQLEGEAFFEVTKDSTRPFVVRTDGAVTRVLGTSFDVSTYPEDDGTKVVVSEGRVEVHSDRPSAGRGSQEGVVLTKRQMGRLLRSGEQVVRKNLDVDRHLGWMEGRLVFEEAPFKEVVRKLERWYAITINLEEGTPIPQGHLNARFAEDQPLNEVLSVVATAFGLEYEHHKKRITFTLVKESGLP